MTAVMIDVLEVIAFAIVGAGSFTAGYMLRYLFSTDYDAGYCQGYEDGMKVQKQQHKLGK